MSNSISSHHNLSSEPFRAPFGSADVGPEEEPAPFDAHSSNSDTQASDSAAKEFGYPPEALQDLEQGPPSRRESVILRVQSRLPFFHDLLASKRSKLFFDFGLRYLIMAVLTLGVFSIYWGSLYKRSEYYKNLRMLVVIEDDHVNGIDPIIGNTMREVLLTEQAAFYGQWHIYNSSVFGEMAAKHNNSIEAEIHRQIHHQEFWTSIYVKPNASYNLFAAIRDGASYNVTNSSVLSIYETGRDFLNMNAYVRPNMQIIERMFLAQLSNVSSYLVSQLPNKTVLENPASIRLVASPLNFEYLDRIPFTDAVITAPSQVGLIYQIILAFFSFNFFMEVNTSVGQFKLKHTHNIAYRIISSAITFFVLSLFYSLVTLAMQVDFTKAFGRSGFLVYWMTTFMTIWIVGQINEIVAMLLVLVFPPLLGFWILFWVFINIAPTFTPIALLAKFYRYGYAMPIHASYEISKVIFFNTYKGALGRNYAILIIWLVISLAATPPTILFFNRTMANRAKRAAQKAAEKS